MAKTNSSMTFHGNPLDVQGDALKVGDSLPDFSLVGLDMSEVSSASFEGNSLVVLSVPSLDTPVCDIEAKRFNSEAAALVDQKGSADELKVLVVSRDLPFAQARWCGATDSERLVCGSDYKERNFGKAFGTDIPDIGLLARAVFVADSNGKIVHVDYVEELSEEPDYAAAIAAAKGTLS